MTSTSLADIQAGKKPESPVAAFGRFMDKMKPQMALALPKHMNSDRMARLALTAFSTTPALQQCTHTSIAASIMTAAQLGLEIGVQGQGYLIPYKKNKKVDGAWTSTWECQFIPGWKGLVDLVARSGRATVWTGAVFDGDDFEYQLGDAPFCRHRPSDDRDDDAQWTHVYAIGRVRDAQMPVIEVWSRNRVNKHLAQYNKVGDKHYAKTDENNFEMYGRKIALLQVLKYVPSSIELAAAVTIAQAEDEGKGMVIDGDFVTMPAESIDSDTGEITHTKPTNDDAKAAEPTFPDAFADAVKANKAAFEGAKAEVKGPTYAHLADMIQRASKEETANEVLDLARHLPADQQSELAAIIAAKFPTT
jgi:recombination protein RecT